MQEILFLSHRIPFPPDRGDKIRSHHILRALAGLAPVHVATFADDDFDMGEEVELAAMAASYCLTRRVKPLVLAGVQALMRRLPVSLPAFHDSVLAAYVANVLSTRPIGTIFVFSGQMGQYIPDSFKGRVIVDFVDVDSAKFEAYAARDSGPVRWINAREALQLGREEARLARRADASLLITAEEAALFAQRLPADLRARAQVRVLGNGIDSAFFDSSLVGPEPRMRDMPWPRLIFTGQMDYAPNIDAVTRGARQIMPLVRRECPGATFHVVGRCPTEEVQALHGLNGTHVWGRVDDVRTWLKAADMALVPIDIGRGVQNKVLEAMAMAMPVVVSPAAATGIGAVDGKHFVVADSDEALAAAVVRLAFETREASQMAMAARRFVTEHQSWQSALAILPELIGAPRRVLPDAA